MNKKGYFFILDAFLAATIIAFTLVAILGSDVTVSQRTSDFTQADAISKFLLDTKLEDIDNQMVKDLIANGYGNPRSTVMEQIDTFYYISSKQTDAAKKTYYQDLSRNLLKNVSEPIVSQKYGYVYIIHDVTANYTVYERSLSTFNSTNFRVVTKRIAYVRINQTAVFAPHIVEFSLWIK